MSFLRVLGLLLSASLLAGKAECETLIVDGISFTDSPGTMQLLGVSGKGTRQDPFVVRERIYSDGAVILSIGGLDGAFGFAPRNSFFLTKIVTNDTKHEWNDFEMELRELRTRRSSYEDGLSFGQGVGKDRKFGSDRFLQAYQNDEPIDAITFYDGMVKPGESVTFSIQITDYSPRWEIFLFQRRESPVSMRSDP